MMDILMLSIIDVLKQIISLSNIIISFLIHRHLLFSQKSTYYLSVSSIGHRMNDFFGQFIDLLVVLGTINAFGK